MDRESYSRGGEWLIFDDDIVTEEIELRLPLANNMSMDDFLKQITCEFKDRTQGYKSVIFPTTAFINGMHGNYMKALGSRRATEEELEFRNRARSERAAFEKKKAEEQEARERAEFERLQAKFKKSPE